MHFGIPDSFTPISFSKASPKSSELFEEHVLLIGIKYKGQDFLSVMIKILVVETRTFRILFQSREVEGQPTESESKMIQLLTPILVSQRILQDHFGSQVV